MKTRFVRSLVSVTLALAIAVSGAVETDSLASTTDDETASDLEASATTVEFAPDSSTPAPTGEVVSVTTVSSDAEGRGHFKKMMMSPYMLIPQLIALGFAPIVLANLKMMVMSALMMNNMALNAAIFMTIRNMVFGPRPTVKYVNYGYRDHYRRKHQQHFGGGHQLSAPDHSLRSRPQQEQQQQQWSNEETETIDRRIRTNVIAS